MYNYVRKLYMFIRQHLLCLTFAVFIHFFNTKHLKNTAATMVYSSLNSACSFTLSPQPTTAHTVGDKSMTNDKFCMDSLFVFLQWPCIYPRLFPWHQNNTDILFAGSHCARVPVVWVCHSHIVICLHIFFLAVFWLCASYFIFIIVLLLQVSTDKLHIWHQRSFVREGCVSSSEVLQDERWVWEVWYAKICGRSSYCTWTRLTTCITTATGDYIL